MRLLKLIPVFVLLIATPCVFAARVCDMTRLNGSRTNVLVGTGLVIGLNKTGDGKDLGPTTRALNTMIAHTAPGATIDLSEPRNVAIVSVTVTLPAEGVRNGDHLDAQVMSIGSATNLKGGTLYMVSMLGPTGKPYTPHDAQGNALQPMAYAIAEGEVELTDQQNPLSGTVKGGAVMEVDLPCKVLDAQGRFQLILSDKYASWTTANDIAKLINEADEAGNTVAVANDAKTITVTIPASERSTPSNYISNVLQMTVRQLPQAAPVENKAVSASAPANKGSSPGSQWWPGACLLLVGWLGARKSKASHVQTH